MLDFGIDSNRVGPHALSACEEFIPGPSLFPGPVHAAIKRGQRDSGPTQGRERGRNLVVPRHARPGSPKRPRRKGGASPNNSKQASGASPWQPPAARQLGRRSKRCQGYSLGEAWWKSHGAQTPRQRVEMRGEGEENVAAQGSALRRKGVTLHCLWTAVSRTPLFFIGSSVPWQPGPALSEQSLTRERLLHRKCRCGCPSDSRQRFGIGRKAGASSPGTDCYSKSPLTIP